MVVVKRHRKCAHKEASGGFVEDSRRQKTRIPSVRFNQAKRSGFNLNKKGREERRELGGRWRREEKWREGLWMIEIRTVTELMALREGLERRVI